MSDESRIGQALDVMTIDYLPTGDSDMGIEKTPATELIESIPDPILEKEYS